MQTRVVIGQPWDVEADVLALPIPATASSPRRWSEIDRRLDGALSAYRTVGELRGKPWSSAMLQGRETGAPWILAMGVGESSVVRPPDRGAPGRRHRAAAHRPRRHPAGRAPARGAPWSAWTSAAAVELVTRGVVEGSADPGAIYRDGFTSPPVLDVLTIIVEQGDAAAAVRRRRAGPDHR